MDVNIAQADNSNAPNETTDNSTVLLPIKHRNRMLVRMVPNIVNVPHYFFTFDYRYPQLAEDCVIKKQKTCKDDSEKLVLYVEKTPLDAAPVLSNKVIAMILVNIKKAYLNFKKRLLEGNPWLFNAEFLQDVFFEEIIIAASNSIKTSKFAYISLWSPINMTAYEITDNNQVAELIERIHLRRMIGFSAHLDQMRNYVEILVYHHHRDEAIYNDRTQEFVYYGYGLPEVNYNKDESDY